MRPTVKAFEAFLQDAGIPYVAVTETKRALFSGVKLKSFDFVVYSATGPNILATVKPFSQGNMRAEMGRWEEVFGKGFAAAEVRHRRGRWVYVGLDGRETDAEGQAAQEADAPPKAEAAPAVGGQLLLVETRTQPTLFDTGKG
jgi:hypothetical protein